MNAALNRSMILILTNQSGGTVAQGDVVALDLAHASAFTTTTTSGLVTSLVGVVLDPNGIANGAQGLIAFGGFVPKINLASAAALGDFVKTHTVAKQGTPHAAPGQTGDFAQVLETGATPRAVLFAGSGIGGGGSSGATVLLKDTFIRADAAVVGAPQTGFPPSVDGSVAAGDWGITSNQCAPQSSVAWNCILWDVGTTRYKLTCTLNKIAGLADCGIIFANYNGQLSSMMVLAPNAADSDYGAFMFTEGLSLEAHGGSAPVDGDEIEIINAANGYSISVNGIEIMSESYGFGGGSTLVGFLANADTTFRASDLQAVAW